MYRTAETLPCLILGQPEQPAAESAAPQIVGEEEQVDEHYILMSSKPLLKLKIEIQVIRKLLLRECRGQR